MLNAGLPLGRKLFEEVDTPTGSKVVFEDTEKGVVERESTWIGDIKDTTHFLQGELVAQGSHIFIATAA